MAVIVPLSGNAGFAAREPASSEQIFDCAGLLRRCLEDHELAKRLVEKFLSRLASTIQEIQGLLTAGDWSQAASKVHRLRGESGDLAAMKLHAAATDLEDCLREAGYTKAASYFDHLKAAADECLAARPSLVERLVQSR
jgi:HPt (histidine-containing phosphotransfer) domain-containing protein